MGPPTQLPEPPQLTPFDAKEQQLYFKLLISSLKLYGGSPFQLFVTGIFVGHGLYFIYRRTLEHRQTIEWKALPFDSTLSTPLQTKETPSLLQTRAWSIDPAPAPSITSGQNWSSALGKDSPSSWRDRSSGFLWVGEHTYSKHHSCSKYLGNLSGNSINDVQLIIYRGLSKVWDI